MQTIDARTLAALLGAAGVPPGTITATVDIGGYPSDPGVYIITDDMGAYTRALMALAEAIGAGAADESRAVTVTSRGGQYGGARELCAHMPGWTMSGPLPVLAP